MKELIRRLVTPIKKYYEADNKLFLHQRQYKVLERGELEDYTQIVNRGDRVLRTAIVIAAGVGLLEILAKASKELTHFPRHK